MKYALKKIRNIVIRDIATKEHKCTLADLQNAQLTGNNEVVWADGANGEHLVGFDVNKVSNLVATNGAIDEGYLSLQTGGEIKTVTNGTGVLVSEVITVGETPTTIKLKYKAQGTIGNEVRFVYGIDSTGTPDRKKKFVQGATASATEFEYATTGIITLPTGKFVAGDQVYVEYFPKFSEYEEISNDADKFSESGEVFVNAWFTDICTKQDIPMQLYMPTGKISGAIDLSFGDQAAVQNINIEALTSCGTSGKTHWVLRKYDMENAEATA